MRVKKRVETDFTLTIEDFTESQWEEIIEPVDNKETHSYSSAFLSKSNEVEDEKEKEVYFVIACLLTSRLNLSSPDKPFSNIDIFNDKDVAFFEEIIESITDSEIKSRVGDILWLRTKNHKMAEIAVNSYLDSAKRLEDFEHWTQTARRIERAAQLATMLNRKGELYGTVIQHIKDLLDSCNGEDPNYLSAELMRLLQERREGEPEKHIEFCEKLALTAEAKFDFRKARKYFEIQANWHSQNKDEVEFRKSRLNIAESYEKESAFNFENRNPPYIMASYPIEKAIVAYRVAGSSTEKVEELKVKLKEFQSEAVKELIPISGGKVDISELVIETQKSISGKSFDDALKTFILISVPSDKSAIRTQVEQNRETYVFNRLMPKKLFSSTGRSIAVQPIEGEDAILADMYEYASYSYQISTLGFIEPGRNIIVLEHSVRDYDLHDLLKNHPFIPQERQFIVARGLNAGLNGDFLTAIHFLIPQIEESVRFVLSQSGIDPASFSERGIQDEGNLNKLLSDEKFTQKLEEIFGEDLVFDFRCLLVERFGSNLRNNMAHGLIDHNGFYSYSAVYFWWLSLRFYLLPYLLTTTKTEDEPISEEE